MTQHLLFYLNFSLQCSRVSLHHGGVSGQLPEWKLPGGRFPVPAVGPEYWHQHPENSPERFIDSANDGPDRDAARQPTASESG